MNVVVGVVAALAQVQGDARMVDSRGRDCGVDS